MPFLGFSSGSAAAAANTATSVGTARSSTASHYAANYESVSAGFAEHAFYQVILDNDLLHVGSWWEWFALITLLVGGSRLIVPNLRSLGAQVAAWTSIVCVCAVFLPHLTVIPVLTTVVYTRTTYPWAVVIPHCIVAHAAYRQNYQTKTASSSSSNYPPDRLQALVLSFFLYGFGGSVVADVLMGVPVTALGHARIVPSHILGWLLVWFSPMDVAYRICTDKSWHTAIFLRKALIAAEAVDAVTTPFGRMARAARELRNHATAPLVAGVAVGSGGAALRWLSNCGSWDNVEAALYKATGYCLLFGASVIWPCAAQSFTNPDIHHCDAYNGSDLWRVAVVSLHVLWTLLADGTVVAGHPFVWMGRQLARQLSSLALTCRLGPALPVTPALEHEKKD